MAAVADESGAAGGEQVVQERLARAKRAGKVFLSHMFVPLYVVVVVAASASVQETEAGLSLGGANSSSCADLQVSSTLPEGWLLALSLIPFLLVVDGILGLNWSSSTVAPGTLVVTVVIGLWLFDGKGWREELDLITTAGVVLMTVTERILWTLFDYAFNVFAAFLFLEVVERWGVLASMQEEFESLADNPTKKIVLVLFGFAIAIAVVAPGGSNFLIAGVILIRMNIGGEETEAGKLDQGRRIAAICLFGNGLTSAFNLVGVCIIAIAEDTVRLIAANGVAFPCEPFDLDCAQKQIGFQFSLQFLIFCLVSPTMMVWIYTKSFNAEMRENAFLLLGSGAIYGVVQLLTARFIGPELPCLTSAMAAVAFYLLLHRWQHRHDAVAAEQPTISVLEKVRQHSYMLPFVLLMALLLIVRGVPGLEKLLQGGDNPTAQRLLNPSILNVVVSCDSFIRTFPWLSSSGMMVVWCAMLTPFLTSFRSAELERPKRVDHDLDEDALFWKRYRETVVCSFREAITESSPILVSIASYAALAKITNGFGMTQTIAQALVDTFSSVPWLYTFFAPWIGFLGAFLTGSTTTSNFLFARIELQTALDLGLVTPTTGSAYAVNAVQILGSSAGEIISPMNAVFSAVLLKSQVPESDMIKQVLGLFCVWMAMCMVVSWLALNVFKDAYV